MISNKYSMNVSPDYVLTNQGEIDVLSKYILDYPNVETGGQLFGYWTFDEKPVILFVLGPGPKAGHHSTFYMQDIEYLKERAILLKRKYGLDHIGEWHSHHQLGIPHPSSYDAHNISTNIRKLGYSKFLLCIGTCTDTESSVNAFMFSASRTGYEQIPWLIKNIDSPFRQPIMADESNAVIPPFVKIPNMVGLWIKDHLSKSSRVEYQSSYWLTQKANAKILKAIIDNLKTQNPSNEYVPTLDQSNEVHIEVYQDESLLEDIHFTKMFPIEAPCISGSYAHIQIESSQWCYGGDILTSFLSYYNNLTTLKAL